MCLLGPRIQIAPALGLALQSLAPAVQRVCWNGLYALGTRTKAAGQYVFGLGLNVCALCVWVTKQVGVSVCLRLMPSLVLQYSTEGLE